MKLKLNTGWVWFSHPNEVLCIWCIIWVANTFTAINKILYHSTSLIISCENLKPVSIRMSYNFLACWRVRLVDIDIVSRLLSKTKNFITTSWYLKDDFDVSLFNAPAISRSSLWSNCKPMNFCLFPCLSCQITIVINVAFPITSSCKVSILVSHKNNFSVAFKPSSNC